LTLWKDADPDIPILKQAKTEYAKLQQLSEPTKGGKLARKRRVILLVSCTCIHWPRTNGWQQRKLEALIIGPKSNPSFDFGQLALPKFVAGEGDVGRGDRI